MIKKILLGLMVIGLFTACNDKEENKVTKEELVTKQVQETNNNLMKKAEEITANIKEEAKKAKNILEEKSKKAKETIEVKAEEVKKSIKNKIESKTEINPALLYKACASCHGTKANKKALGKSEIISSWSEDKITLALMGYKNGTYGKTMKGLMQGQTKKLSEEEIKILAKHITTLNK